LAFHQLAHTISNSTVIQNPVNLPSFEALPFPSTKNGKIKMAVIGRLMVSDKGQDMLVSLLKDPFFDDHNISVSIYGAGPDRQYLEELIQYYQVGDRISIQGHIDDIVSAWNDHHCLLMPSLQEGTPLTLLEALVLGRVCIVTDVGGNNEWIEDGINGFLADAATPSLILKKIKEAFLAINDWPGIAATAHHSAIKKLDRQPGMSILKLALA
jgi:glycosyltransferase involved in cell wall biosynthesis